jgi:hypothetical protein
MPKAIFCYDSNKFPFSNNTLRKIGVFVQKELALVIEKTADCIDVDFKPYHPAAIMSQPISLEIVFMNNSERLQRLNEESMNVFRKRLYEEINTSLKRDEILYTNAPKLSEEFTLSDIGIWTQPLAPGGVHIM